MALLVTLIVLLILATVSLSAVFSEKGIFNRAEKAGTKYNEAKAREVLETVLLADGQYEKNINPEYNQDDFLDKLIKSQIEGADVKGDVAIVGDYAYELDRSVPKIGTGGNNGYLGLEKDLIWPTVEIIKNPELIENGRKATFKIRATIDEKATKGITRVELWLNGKKLNQDREYKSEQRKVEEEYTVNRNGVYTIKAYAELMGSNKTTVEGIVPSVEFSPNGSTEWKKEHSTKITVKETAETVTEMKYVWTNSEDEPTEFTETCTNNSTITGGNETMTGKYYLWVWFKTSENKTNICGSNAFYFDNEGPTVELTSTPISETSFTLTATATDNQSGIAKYEFYINDIKVDTQTTTEETATYTWNGTEMQKNKECYVIVTDEVGNFTKIEKAARTKIHFWEEYDLQEKVEGYISKKAITDKEVMKTDNPMSWLHHDTKRENIYRHLYSLTEAGTISVSEDGKRLIRQPVSGIKGNNGNIDWMWAFANLRENVPFYFVCWGSSSEVGPDCGYQVNSIRAKDDNYYYVSGFEFEWVEEIPEGPKGNTLREISSIESGFKPINGKENNKWYKYIGTK